MSTYGVTDPTYQALSSADDDPSKVLAGIVSPASAADLVGPPPDSPPPGQPGQSTVRTGNLADPPKQAVAKNQDTAIGRTAYNTAQPVQQASASPVAPLRPAGPQPVVPAGGVQPVNPLAAKTTQDQATLAQLQAKPAGGSQIVNPVGRGIVRTLDTLGSIVAPNVTQFIPGSTLNKQRQVGIQQGIVGNDQAQQQSAATLADTQQKTALDAAKAAGTALIQVTPDMANVNPALKGLVGQSVSQQTLGGVAKAATTGNSRVDVQNVKNAGQIDKQDDPDSYQAKNAQSLEDVRQTQQVLNKARADAANADPSTPAGRMAIAKLREADAGHTAAMVRAQAAMGNYLMHSRGVGLDNQSLPGQFQITNDSGQTTGLGTSFQKAVSEQQSRVSQFNDVFGALNNFEGAAKALDKSGGKLNDPQVAAALADPHSTSAQWAQGEFANSGLNASQRNYVIAKKAFDENLQAMRKSAGGTATDAAVNRLAAMAPGAQTPDLDYFLRQTGQIRQTAKRLSTGIPNVQGGHKVNTGSTPPANPGGTKSETWVRGKDGKLVKQ